MAVGETLMAAAALGRGRTAGLGLWGTAAFARDRTADGASGALDGRHGRRSRGLRGARGTGTLVTGSQRPRAVA
jgi:hypothetical protein